MTNQPQLQRMDAGQVALVGQVVLARGVGVEQAAQTSVGACRVAKLLAHEGGKAVEIALRQHAQVGGGLRHGPRRHRVAQDFEAIGWGNVAVLVPVGAQETQPFSFGKAVEEGLPGLFVILVAQAAGRRIDRLVSVVMHNVAHDAHERKIDRLFKRFGHARHLAVVFVLEIAEAVNAAAGEEGFTGAGRIAAFHGRFEQGFQRRFGLGAQDVDGPVAQAVGRMLLDLGQFLRRRLGMAFVQVGDDQQVGNQGPELGAGAEIELGPGVDVERLVEVVGLDAQDVCRRRAFVERQAVIDLLRVALGQ